MPDKIIFTEEFCQPENLYPFTLTRQIQDIRVGILTIRKKWEIILGLKSYDRWEDDYKDLDKSVHIDRLGVKDTCFMIHGNMLPTERLIRTMKQLKNGEFISVNGNTGVIFRFSRKEIQGPNKIKVNRAVTVKEKINTIRFPWEIFQLNAQAIGDDFKLLTTGRKSVKIPVSNKAINPSGVFIEKGARVTHSVLNASEGPIYIGKNALVMEGCLIRGPFSLGEGAVLKMGARVYGATSIGPGCVAGGEIKNCVLFAYSNKAHDGYLGDSVIGAWCNLGAGTTNSNMKNNASEVKVWTPQGEMTPGRKCGVFMGDYSKTAVNTSINTGTVIGPCCNVFGGGLTPKFIPAFSWGYDGVQRYKLDKALADVGKWKSLRDQSLTKNEKTILKYIYEHY